MINEKKLANYVYRHDGRVLFSSTLMDVKGLVALRAGNGDFDNLDLKEIRLLSELCSRDASVSADSIANVIGEDKKFVVNTLELLCELGFAEEDYSGYKAPLKGREIIAEVAQELLMLDKFKYKQGLQEIEYLQNKLNQSAC